MRFLKVALPMFVLAIISNEARALPQFVLFQGRLLSGGVATNAPANMEFRVTNGAAVPCATAANASTVFWTSGAQSVTTSSGVFSYKLGLQPDQVTQDPAFAAINWFAPGATYSIDSCVAGASLGKEPIGAGIFSVTANSAGAVLNATDSLIHADSSATGTGAVRLRTGSSDKVFVTNSGNVGVGTSAPAQKLDVQSGNINTSGNVTALGSLGIGTTSPQSALDVRGVIGGGGTSGIKVGSDGKVGIGTTSPQSALDVRGVIGGGGTGGIAVDANGNVGIGYTNPVSRLTVNGDIRIGFGTGGKMIFQDGTEMNTANITSAGSVSYTGNALVIGDSNGIGVGDVILKTGLNDRLHILNDGKVGIGTSNPASALDVRGVIGGGGVSGIFVDSAGKVGIGTTNPQSALDVRGIIGGGGPGGIFVDGSGNVAATGDLTMNGVGSSSFAGKLGIGTTAPGHKLDVQGGNINASGNVTSSAGALIMSGAGASSFAGNVGIGMTNPSSRLTVNGDIRIGFGTAGKLIFQDGTEMISAGLGSAGSLSNASHAVVTSNTDLVDGGDVIFNAGFQEKMRITNSGGIGIGTTNPQVKLHLQNPLDEKLLVETTGGGSAVFQAKTANRTYSFGILSSGDWGIRDDTSNEDRLRMIGTGNVQFFQPPGIDPNFIPSVQIDGSLKVLGKISSGSGGSIVANAPTQGDEVATKGYVDSTAGSAFSAATYNGNGPVTSQCQSAAVAGAQCSVTGTCPAGTVVVNARSSPFNWTCGSTTNADNSAALRGDCWGQASCTVTSFTVATPCVPPGSGLTCFGMPACLAVLCGK